MSGDGWNVLVDFVCILSRGPGLSERTQTQTAYFLSSLPADAQRILDVIFAEDASRIRLDNAPENCAVLPHVAFNLLMRQPSKACLNRKRYRAPLPDSFRLDLLSHF